MKVTRIDGGYPQQREEADKKGVTLGTQWEVVGGEINDWTSYYKLKGVEGKFNCAMFDLDYEHFSHLMNHN